MVARPAEAVEAEEEQEIKSVIDKLQKSLQTVPEDYFNSLRSRLAAALAIE